MRSKPILLTLLLLLSGGLLLALSAAMPADANAADNFVSPRLSDQRFFATSNTLNGRDDVTLLVDYGGYGLYEASSTTLSSLLGDDLGGRVWLDYNANVLQFDAFPLNTQQGAFDFPEPFSVTAPEGPAHAHLHGEV